MLNTNPNHHHTYDAQGKMTCCSLEDKINSKSEHSHDEHDHDHEQESAAAWKEYIPLPSAL